MKGALVPRNTFLLLRLSSENSIPYVLCGETPLARQHALLRPIASLASNSAAYCACQFPCWATPAASSSHSHTLHIHTRFTLTHASHSHASHSHTLHIHTRFTSHTLHITHASHSHTLHIHTRFTSHTLHITHASHSHTLRIHTHTHTRQPFRLVPHIVLVCLAKGNTGSVKFTFTHAHTRLAKGNTGSVKFTFTHTHTRLAKGNTGSVRFTFTHASHSRIENTHTLAKGLRRCTRYLL
jgi:hypothetical protein